MVFSILVSVPASYAGNAGLSPAQSGAYRTGGIFAVQLTLEAVVYSILVSAPASHARNIDSNLARSGAYRTAGIALVP